MNYRHIFHAGNICDVVKHSVLSLMIEHLRGKEAPFCVLDTHAGIGCYDLEDPRAGKTNEASDGILKLLNTMSPSHLREGLGEGREVTAPSSLQHSSASPPSPPSVPPASGREALPQDASHKMLESYLGVLRKLNLGWMGNGAEAFRYYPGSPLLATHMLRLHDRLISCELHPEDAETLKRQLFPFKQAQAHHRDGYEALGAFLPPAEKRGLVLIDPPFEEPNEFDRLTEALKTAHTRWPQGILMAWYPIKERPAIWRFHDRMIGTEMPKILAAEFIYREETQADRLNGSGLILVNPPWQMDEKLRNLFPALHQALGTEYNGDAIKWLAGEE
jgi:23S rRNA (adenine2030-N6)-methyltransferase